MRAKANVVMPERAYLYPLGRELYKSRWAVANEKARAADGVIFKFLVWAIFDLTKTNFVNNWNLTGLTIIINSWMATNAQPKKIISVF